MSDGTDKQKVIVRRSFDGRHDVQYDIMLNFRYHRDQNASSLSCNDIIAGILVSLVETSMLVRKGDNWVVVFDLDLDPLEVLREHFEVELVEM